MWAGIREPALIAAFFLSATLTAVCCFWTERRAEPTADNVVLVMLLSDLTFGLARVWESLTYGGAARPRVFRTRQAAEEALHRFLLPA